MRASRPAILLAVTLLLAVGYVGRSAGQPSVQVGDATESKALPLKNSIIGLKVARDSMGRWMADFDFVYTGAPFPAFLKMEVPQGTQLAAGVGKAPRQYVAIGLMKPGQYHVSAEIDRPLFGSSLTTKSVTVYLETLGQELASERVTQVIEWPSYAEWKDERDFAGKGPEARLNRATALIDNGGEPALSDAKRMLEGLVAKEPRYSPAFVGLARVAMKTNWGPEGLHQAETLLDSALRLQPDNIDAKILLGYVYAHQRKYAPAEALMAEAAKSGTSNLWNLANWGELLAAQGKIEPAIQKYREALARPRTDEANDRARLDAYGHLLVLLDSRKNLGDIEALYRQRAEEFGPGSCYSADYSRFILQQRGDAGSAITLARQAVEGHCADPEARTALGLAYYVAWAGTSDLQRFDSLNKARVYLPAGPKVLYLLAGGERTLPAAKQLVGSGEAIDQRDNYKFTALAYALQNRDYAAARRLLQLGARTDTTIGEDEVPVALAPAISGDIEGVRIMQRAGVNYSKLRYHGITAVEMARQSGDRKMLEALNPKQTF